MGDSSIENLMIRDDRAIDLSTIESVIDLGLTKEEAKEELTSLLPRMALLQHRLMAESKQSLLIVLQGRDASGKDGLIRHVMTGLNPAGVHVTSFKVPSGAEVFHDYLWRCHACVPAKGDVGVWNRSHYEDILVPRVKKLVDDSTWQRRYRHIREFERMLSDEGTRIVKFYLHVSHEVQRKRLQKRVDNPESGWKHDPSDLTDRALWPLYQQAYEELLVETSRPYAPWFILPSDLKWARDLVFAKIVLSILEEMDPQLPTPDPHLQGITVT